LIDIEKMKKIGKMFGFLVSFTYFLFRTFLRFVRRMDIYFAKNTVDQERILQDGSPTVNSERILEDGLPRIVQELPLPIVQELPLPIVQELPLPIVQELPLPIVQELPLPIVQELPLPGIWGNGHTRGRQWKVFHPRTCTDSSGRDWTKNPSPGELGTREALRRIYGEGFRYNVFDSGIGNPETDYALEIDCYDSERKIGVEYNGVQHYKFTGIFHDTDEDFESQQRRDHYKREQCKELGITLIIVPYTVDKRFKRDDKENRIKAIETHIISELTRMGHLLPLFT
jgi:hypothetical protein